MFRCQATNADTLLGFSNFHRGVIEWLTFFIVFMKIMYGTGFEMFGL